MASHLSQRWVGIILRIIRHYYPNGRVLAWGPVVEEGRAAVDRGERLELALIDPRVPDPDCITAIRAELIASDLPNSTDIRSLDDLTLDEQEEALSRGEQFGG